MILCTGVSEEGGDGEGPGSEPSSLLSYTLKYISLTHVDILCQVGFRQPIHLCTYVNQEGEDEENTPDVVILCQDVRFIMKR